MVLVVGDSADPAVHGGSVDRVSTKQLRSELEQAKVSIQPGSDTSASTVSGVASQGRAAIGFEFRVYPSSDEATVRGLGNLSLGDLGYPSPNGVTVKKVIRGVLGNVAYAQYRVERDWKTERAYLEENESRREVIRELDDALFRSFPPDNPYAQPLLSASGS